MAEGLNIKIPSIREVLELGEDTYLSAASTLISVPYSYLVPLYEKGILYTDLDEFEFFCGLFKNMPEKEFQWIFPGVINSDFEMSVVDEDKSFILYNQKTGVSIDSKIYKSLTNAVSEICGIPKPINKKIAFDASFEYFYNKEKKAIKRRGRKPYEPFIEGLIISLVNCAEFKYNYEQTMDLTLWAFMKSVKQIQKKINYDNVMTGYYTGNISPEKLPMESKSWM